MRVANGIGIRKQIALYEHSALAEAAALPRAHLVAVPLAWRGRGCGRGTVAIRLNCGYDPVVVTLTVAVTVTVTVG